MAKKFLIFVIDTAINTADKGEIVAIDAFNEKLVQGGHWIAAGGLSTPDKALLIDNRRGAKLSQVGALFSGQENYSGFWFISAESESEAEQLAYEGSLACNRKVELRPLL